MTNAEVGALTNAEVGAFLTRLSEFVQLRGDNAFRSRALANGARIIEEFDIGVVEMALELDSHPYRLDLDWRNLRKAKDLGIPIPVNTDAHRLDELDYLDLSVGIARKGWLRPGDVVNTLSRRDLQDFLQSP